MGRLSRAPGIPWPWLDSGQLDLTDETFRQMAKVLSSSSRRSRAAQLIVGPASQRSRCRTVTEEIAQYCRPSARAPAAISRRNTKSIFGPAVWLRGLIKPPPGYGIAYIDWSQQEFGIAAALSGDKAMQAAYQSGDPYLAFAKQAGAVPADATKQTHGAERELFKQCVLAVQYGMGAEGLALRIGQPVIVARDLCGPTARHIGILAVVGRGRRYAMLHGSLHTVFGWHAHRRDTNPRSLRNFPMQANGAEMLRLAAAWPPSAA